MINLEIVMGDVIIGIYLLSCLFVMCVVRSVKGVFMFICRLGVSCWNRCMFLIVYFIVFVLMF